MSDALLDLQLELVENHGLLLDLEADGVDVDALWSPKSTLAASELLALPSLDLVRRLA